MSTVRISKEYMRLLARFPLRPISSKKHLREAMDVLNNLLILDNTEGLTKDEEDYMLVLSGLVKEYEEASLRSVGNISPARALKFLMETNGLSQSDLVPVVGYKSNLSAFLAGRRNLSKVIATKLGHRFKVDPSLFLPSI